MTDTQSSVTSSKAPKGIDIEDILYCIDTLKLTHEQTADRLGCHPTNITRRLQVAGFKQGDLISFKDAQADKYAIRRMRIAKNISDDKLKKMSAYQLVGMDSVTLNAERLIRGESTANLAYADMSKDLETIRAKRAALRLELGMDDEDAP